MTSEYGIGVIYLRVFTTLTNKEVILTHRLSHLRTGSSHGRAACQEQDGHRMQKN